LTKHLLEQGASVTALVRDSVPASEFVRQGLADRVNVYAEVSPVLIFWNERSPSTRSKLSFICRPDHRRDSQSQSAFDFREQRAWNLESSGGVPPFADGQVGDHRFFGQGLWRSENAPLQRGHAAQGKHPYDVSKSCADLIAQSYAHTFGVPWRLPDAATFMAVATLIGIASSPARFAP
jgi:dTDP-D-glucose 4,6-dehydratase